jgi:hypothetical protein
VDPPLGGAIEEAAVARLELEHAAGRLDDEGPHQLLIVDPAAAGKRVEEMRVERIGFGEHGVVAALNHPRAPGAAEQPFDDDGHGEARRAIGGMERGAEPGSARAEDQHVGLETLDYRAHEPATVRLTVAPS